MVNKCKTPAEVFTAFFSDGKYTQLFSAEKNTVMSATGIVGGQPLYALCQNGQAMRSADVSIFTKTYNLAAKTGKPVVTFFQSEGYALDEGMAPLKAVSELNNAIARISGVVPHIAVVLGVCGASSALAAASADICIITKEAELFLISSALDITEDNESTSGSPAYAVESGIAGMLLDDSESAIQKAAELISLLPSNNLSLPAVFEFSEPSENISIEKFTAQSAITSVVDNGSALTLYEGFGDAVTTAIATISGNVVGIVATHGESSYLGSHCTSKTARFVRFCDAFSLPVVTIVNTGGFIKDRSSDISGGLRNAARLTVTYNDATTAKIAVLAGKVVSSTFSAFANADLVVAVEGAVISSAEPSAVVSVLHRDEILNSGQPIETATKKYIAEYIENTASASAALSSGIADMLTTPQGLRNSVVQALELLVSKRESRLPKKHGNTQL